jgi:hypothetical protein
VGELRLDYRAGDGDIRAAVGAPGPPGMPGAAHLQLPATSARQLKVWTHRVSSAGDSEPLAARVELCDAGETCRVDLGESDGQAVVPLSGAPCQMDITL